MDIVESTLRPLDFDFGAEDAFHLSSLAFPLNQSGGYSHLPFWLSNYEAENQKEMSGDSITDQWQQPLYEAKESDDVSLLDKLAKMNLHDGDRIEMNERSELLRWFEMQKSDVNEMNRNNCNLRNELERKCEEFSRRALTFKTVVSMFYDREKRGLMYMLSLLSRMQGLTTEFKYKNTLKMMEILKNLDRIDAAVVGICESQQDVWHNKSNGWGVYSPCNQERATSVVDSSTKDMSFHSMGSTQSDVLDATSSVLSSPMGGSGGSTRSNINGETCRNSSVDCNESNRDPIRSQNERWKHGSGYVLRNAIDNQWDSWPFPREWTNYSFPHATASDKVSQLKFLATANVVGKLFDCNGENIRLLQSKYRVRISTSGSRIFYPGTGKQVLLMKGKLLDILHAMRTVFVMMIPDILEVKDLPADFDARAIKFELCLVVPSTTSNKMLSSRGAQIQWIQQQTKARIHVACMRFELGGVQERLATITGLQLEVEQTIELIAMIVQDDPSGDSYNFLNYPLYTKAHTN